MIRRIENRHLRAQLFRATEKLTAQSGMHVLPRQRRKQPRSSFKKIGVGVLYARLLFTRHGMPSDKTLSGGFSKRLGRTFHNLSLRVAYIGHQRARPQVPVRSFE